MDGSRPSSPSKDSYAISNLETAAADGLVSHSRSGTGPSNSLLSFIAQSSDTAVNSFCGAAAGVASGIVTCPLDVIKTKLQAQGGFRPKLGKTMPGTLTPYHGLLGTARQIWVQDGLRGMYRGLSPMLFGYLPTWAVYMSVYGSSKEYFYSRLDNKTFAQGCASVTAGACSTLVTNPIWVIKTRLMSQVGSQASRDARTPWHYRSTADAFQKMYKTEGIRAFYSGLAPALLGLTHVAIQFPLYEYFKLRFTGLEMGKHSPNSSENQWVGVMGATFLSKVCATSATYPHEVLRTRLQTQQRQHAISSRSLDSPLQKPRYQGIWSSCQTILKEEGWRAFYYGMGTNLVRAVPAAITTMLTFETLKRYIDQIRLSSQANVALE